MGSVVRALFADNSCRTALSPCVNLARNVASRSRVNVEHDEKAIIVTSTPLADE